MPCSGVTAPTSARAPSSSTSRRAWGITSSLPETQPTSSSTRRPATSTGVIPDEGLRPWDFAPRSISGTSASARFSSCAPLNGPKQSERIPIRNGRSPEPPQPHATSASARASATAALARIAHHPGRSAVRPPPPAGSRRPGSSPRPGRSRRRSASPRARSRPRPTRCLAPTVTPRGPRATATLRTTRFVRGSSSTTRSRSWSVIHTPPAPAATFAGGKPSAIVATIRRVRGSIRQSRRSLGSPTTQIAPSPVAIPASASRKLPALSGCGKGIGTVASIRTSPAATSSRWTLGQPAIQTPYVPLVRLQARTPTPPVCSAPTTSNCETLPENLLGPSAATYAYPPCTVTSKGRPIAGILTVSPDAGSNCHSVPSR